MYQKNGCNGFDEKIGFGLSGLQKMRTGRETGFEWWLCRLFQVARRMEMAGPEYVDPWFYTCYLLGHRMGLVALESCWLGSYQSARRTEMVVRYVD